MAQSWPWDSQIVKKMLLYSANITVMANWEIIRKLTFASIFEIPRIQILFWIVIISSQPFLPGTQSVYGKT